MTAQNTQLFQKTENIIAGTDEAGRGPLAGPVVAAAVILSPEQQIILQDIGLKDSKKLSAGKREKIFAKICSLDVLWSAQAASAAKIDKINILEASLWCMKRSVQKLSIQPDIVLVDGNKEIPNLGIRQDCIIGGDDKIPAISAASVIAKVLRDRIMLCYDKIYPEYGFLVTRGTLPQSIVRY